MLLKIGSKGEDVKKLQAKLGLSADGSFGPGTEKAVKKWQIDNDLAADGIVGEGTWNKMFGSQQVIAEPAPVVSTSFTGLNLEKLRGHIPDAVIAQIPDTAKKFCRVLEGCVLQFLLTQAWCLVPPRGRGCDVSSC